MELSEEVVGGRNVANWLRVILTTVVLAEIGSKTAVRLTWAIVEDTKIMVACFTRVIDGFGKNCFNGFAIINEFLKEEQAKELK